MAIANSDKTVGEEINIASGQEIRMEELANRIIKKINPTAKVLLDQQRVRPEKSEVMRLLGSNKKIIGLTDWKQEYSFDEGIEETIEWFKHKDNLKFYKSNIYNV